MTSELMAVDVLDDVLPEPRTARIARDIAVVEELAVHGFEGPVYKTFENGLCRESWPILRGMLRTGVLIRLSVKWFTDHKVTFFVPSDHKDLLRTSGLERDELLVDVLMPALRKFRLKALMGGGWDPTFKGPKGPGCLTSYFIGLCILEFRRAYLQWARKRARLEQQEAALLDPEAFFRLLPAPAHLAEPETVLFRGWFMDLLASQPADTQAVVRLTFEGYRDGEIADRLKSTLGAVRNRRSRFRTVLYQAARERRIWIPEQLHVNGSRTPQRSGV
ncbi:RNA polymerase sigma factor [Streptomyces mirabilis]|uniref:RNA polymerase sigma factor n=1 Tax=Streptomyces mirabilis TaxID=68239 RepID=UPI003694E6D0